MCVFDRFCNLSSLKIQKLTTVDQVQWKFLCVTMSLIQIRGFYFICHKHEWIQSIDIGEDMEMVSQMALPLIFAFFFSNTIVKKINNFKDLL